MDKKLQEILIITQEECSEVIQAVSKCFRFGSDCLVPDGIETNKSRVEKEIGDLLAMIELLTQEGFVDSVQLSQAKEAKLKKLRIWSNIFD